MFSKLSNKWKVSLAFRLTFFYTCIFAAFFFLVFLFFYIWVVKHIYGTKDAWMLEEIRELQEIAGKPGISPREIEEFMTEEAKHGGANLVFYNIRSALGEIQLHTDDKHWQWLSHNTRHFPWSKRNLLFETYYPPDHSYPVRILYFPTHGKVLQGAVLLKTDKEFLDYLINLFFISYPIIVALFCGLSWIMLRSALRPVYTMTDIAKKISQENLKERIPIENVENELGKLASTLNAMLSRIDTLVAALKEKNDNLAHNLRTLISRIRVNAEVTLLRERSREEYRSALENCLGDCEKLLELLNTMLDISEAESGALALHQKIDLAQILRETTDLFRDLAEYQGLELCSSKVPPLFVVGNNKLLQQAITSIIDNAIKYTPAGGKVTISTIIVGDREALIQITDSGRGISPEDLPHIFDRFYRAKSSLDSPGTGLGLALARAAVAIHGGRTEVQSILGKGSTFRIYLPLATVQELAS